MRDPRCAASNRGAPFWPVTCGWSRSSTCCAIPPTIRSPTNSRSTTPCWPRPGSPGAGVPVHAGTVRRGRPGRGFRLRRAALPAPGLPAPGLRPPGDAGRRTRRRLRTAAGDVREHGPAVPPGLALRPRGRLRAGRLPASALERRTPRGRRPVGLVPDAAPRAGVRRPDDRHRPGEPMPATPEPPPLPRSWRNRPSPRRTTPARSPASGTCGWACTRRRPAAWPRAR